VTSRPVGGKTMSSGGYTSVVAVSLSLMGSPFCAAAALGSALATHGGDVIDAGPRIPLQGSRF